MKSKSTGVTQVKYLIGIGFRGLSDYLENVKQFVSACLASESMEESGTRRK